MRFGDEENVDRFTVHVCTHVYSTCAAHVTCKHVNRYMYRVCECSMWTTVYVTPLPEYYLPQLPVVRRFWVQRGTQYIGVRGKNTLYCFSTHSFSPHDFFNMVSAMKIRT